MTARLPAQSAETGDPSRRQIILTAGAAGLGLVGTAAMVGCTESPSDDDSAARAEGEGTDTPSADRLILGPATDVPVGGGVVYPVERVVVTQPQSGVFVAHGVVCPHQGCAVTQVTAAGILCPCHDSVFDLETGQPLSGPARSGLTPRAVTVDGPDLILG
jgi:nitrite reductase/ring-hydroxylating ferredoxin subunit